MIKKINTIVKKINSVEITSEDLKFFNSYIS